MGIRIVEIRGHGLTTCVGRSRDWGRGETCCCVGPTKGVRDCGTEKRDCLPVSYLTCTSSQLNEDRYRHTINVEGGIHVSECGDDWGGGKEETYLTSTINVVVDP
jgi:hypothetical protein